MLIFFNNGLNKFTQIEKSSTPKIKVSQLFQLMIEIRFHDVLHLMFNKFKYRYF